MSWPNKPKSLTERGYRNFMSKTAKITIDEQEYTLQSVSPSWYFRTNDECGITGGKRNTSDYIDKMLRNCVVSPPEIKAEGIKYFDDKEDIGTPEKLLREIERFLRS